MTTPSHQRVKVTTGRRLAGARPSNDDADSTRVVHYRKKASYAYYLLENHDMCSISTRNDCQASLMMNHIQAQLAAVKKH